MLSSAHMIGNFMYLIIGYKNLKKDIPNIEFTIADLTEDKMIEKQIEKEEWA